MSPQQLQRQLGVYVVTDERPDVNHLLFVIAQALKGGATAVQLRRKHDGGRALVKLGQEIRRITREYAALYIVNDRVDIALLTDADGVHVGQSDISCEDVRRLVGDKTIGVSAATVDEANTAVRDGADYLGVGAIFPTPSKTDADICGLEGLQDIALKVTTVPIVAIGGITLNNATSVVGAGADGLAVVSAIMQATDPVAASTTLKEIVERRAQVTGFDE